ncbi:type VI secretion system contractile sheath small subunit [Cronobacter sakazakii]
MSGSFQEEIPKARINLKLNLHTGGAQKKIELPLKLLVTGDFSHGQEHRPLSERKKIDINKNNFDSVLSEFSPALNLAVENTLAGDGREENVRLTFRQMKDFEPEQVARQIPQLKAMLAMRNLLRDLKSNLLDNATFRRELESVFYKKIKTLHLDFSARAALNVDGDQTPLATMVRVYQLKDRKTLDAADYGSLLQNADTVLKDDLLASRELLIIPNGNVTLDMSMEENAQFVAVVGLFNHPDVKDNRWRLVLSREDLDPDKPGVVELGDGWLNLVETKE